MEVLSMDMMSWLDIFGQNGNAFCVDHAEVGILQ